MFLRKLFLSMGFDKTVSPLALFTDSMGCLFISKGEGTSSALKHVELCDFFTREQITRGCVSLSHVPAEFMVADALTKSLPSAKFRALVAGLVGSDAGRASTVMGMGSDEVGVSACVDNCICRCVGVGP